MKDKVYDSIDWKMLARQKKELIGVAADKHPNLHGIVNIIDEMQDYAVDYLGFPEEEIFEREVNDGTEND